MSEEIVVLECYRHNKFFDNNTLYSHLQKIEGVVLDEKENITNNVKHADNQQIFKYTYCNPKKTLNTPVVERQTASDRGHKKFNMEAFQFKKLSNKENFNAASINEFLLQFEKRNNDENDDQCRTIGGRKRSPMDQKNTKNNQKSSRKM